MNAGIGSTFPWSRQPKGSESSRSTTFAISACAAALLVAASCRRGRQSALALSGCVLPRVADGEPVDLGEALSSGPGVGVAVLGTYPADFNMIEYGQRLRHYLPALKAKGVSRVLCVINGKPSSCKKLADLLDLPAEVELLSDEKGETGRAFGVGRGWLPDADAPPYLKLFGMLLGLGASRTLPSVITGYIGNPWGANGWIQSALAQGQKAGRWPDMALDVDGTGRVTRNAFDELPLVGGWGRRPLELATLRLQTMLGVSLSNWEELQPTDDRCLTQLGGLVAVSPSGELLYEYRDEGICNVCDFEELLKALPDAPSIAPPASRGGTITASVTEASSNAVVTEASTVPPLPTAGDSELLQLANTFIYTQSGFYSPATPSAFSDDFVFRGPVIGPLCKKDYLDTLATFGIFTAFPDISPNAFGFTVDPEEPRRVWFFVRNTGTNTGPLGLGFGISYPPSGNAAYGCVETFSLTFDAENKAKRVTVGYVADRFDEKANTGGSGAALGLMKAAGIVPPAFTAANPLFALGQKLGNALAGGGAGSVRTVSKPEDVPKWWPFSEVGAEGS